MKTEHRGCLREGLEVKMVKKTEKELEVASDIAQEKTEHRDFHRRQIDLTKDCNHKD